MARLPRLILPGYPYYVVQRGNNRQSIVSDDADRGYLMRLLAEQALACHVAIHAYVLLDNRIDLLATPAAAQGLPQMMQALGRRYVRHFNDRAGRTGTLWEGRYRSTLVQAERYMLSCMAFIDLSPVFAGAAAEPRDYRWSSHAHYLGQRQDRLITPPPAYWALGNTPFAREAAYAERVAASHSAALRQPLAEALEGGWVLGDAGFVAALQKQVPRRISKGRAGRPPAIARPSKAPGAAEESP